MGGLTRRAAVIKKMREPGRAVMLLDAGGTLGEKNIENLVFKAHASFKSMDAMGYDAINLGSRDLNLGLEFLQDISESISVPFIASNLEMKEDASAWLHKYVILERGGLKTAVVGVMPENAAKHLSSAIRNRFTIIPPKKALADLVPELQKDVDFIFLLSQLGIEETKALVDEQEGGVNLAIIAGGITPEEVEIVTSHVEGRLAPTYRNGSQVGYMSIDLLPDSPNPLWSSRPRYVELVSTMEGDEEVKNLISELDAKHNEIMHQRLMANLKRSPHDVVHGAVPEIQFENPEDDPAFSAFADQLSHEAKEMMEQKEIDRKKLEERVNGYMKAKQDQRRQDIYSYFSSSYRESHSEAAFLADMSEVGVQDYAINSIKINPSGQQAEVELEQTINMGGFDFEGAKSEQTWIKENDTWFIKPKPYQPPFPMEN